MYQREKVKASGIHCESFCGGAAAVLTNFSLALISSQVRDESIVWRVHHVPLLSTLSEREAVHVSDDLHKAATEFESAGKALADQLSR